LILAVSRPDHIIDTLIAERAPHLAAGPTWPLLRPLLYAILDYGKARRMADAIKPLPGDEALDFVSRLLGISVQAQGLARLPRRGRLIVVCNHPTGIADGVAVYDVLRGVRPDVMFYANADAHRVAPRFDDVLIPVEWIAAKRTRERTRLTLARTREAMQAERALVIFPSGRMSRRVRGVLADPPWAAGAVSVARRYDAPIAPVRLTGPSSTLFHVFNRFSPELRDITVFHELLNKRGKTFSLTVGHSIPPSALPADAGEAARAMQSFVETTLANDPSARFGTAP
jgi:putative hemolysin